MRETIKNSVYGICWGLRNALDPLLNFEEVSIFAYHSISNARVDTAISPEAFERQLKYLSEHGHSFVPVAAILAWMDGAGTLPRKAVAITFDDGYADFETTALPILEKFKAPATQYIVGDAVAARGALGNDIPLLSAEALQRVRRHLLVEIGFHSMTHANLSRLPGDALVREVASPFPARFFAYPGGNHSPSVAEAVRKAGYAAAFSIGQGLVRKNSSRYLLPRNVIIRGMPLWQVALRATKAIQWYRTLISFIK